MRKGTWLGSLAALVVLGCGSNASVEKASSTQQDWTCDGVGVGALRGHEDITRFAVEHANSAINSELKIAGFYPTITSGESCKSTGNVLLKGDCHTDFPDDNDEFVTFYGVTASDWQTDPTVQELHYLRNYPNDKLDSAKQTCVNIQQVIITATNRGLNYWAQNKKPQAMYWFGHCLHMIQDSFAPPHTRRNGTNNRVLNDICTYAKEFPGVCYHQKVETSDRPWSSSLSCQLNPNDRSWDCLVTLAQRAADASTGYLRVVARHIQNNPSGDIAPALHEYYSKTTPDQYEGYFNCSTLPGSAVYPDAGTDTGPDAPLDTGTTPDSGTVDGSPLDAADATTIEDGGMDVVDSGTADAEIPDSTIPETDSTAPDSTIPETDSAADSTIPETDSAADSTIPETDSAAADSTVPPADASAQDSTTPPADAPDSTTPTADAPDSTTPPADAPDSTIPDAKDSGVEKDGSSTDAAKDGSGGTVTPPSEDEAGESGGCSTSATTAGSKEWAAIGLMLVGAAIGLRKRSRKG